MLKDFGMIGVGEICRAAMRRANSSTTMRWRSSMHRRNWTIQPLTEALVDFEVTLAASCCAGAIGADEEEELVQIARRLYFQNRTIDRILAGSSLSAARCAEVAELFAAQWLNVKAR